MEKINLTATQIELLQKTDDIILTGDVNLMLEHLAKLMEDGLTPTPRQIAKISAHIYKTNNLDLILEFGIKYAGLGSFTEKLAEVVLEEGSAEDNFDFAQYVPNADVVAHGKAIKKRKNKMWWSAFVKLFPEQAKIIVDSKEKDLDSNSLQR